MEYRPFAYPNISISHSFRFIYRNPHIIDHESYSHWYFGIKTDYYRIIGIKIFQVELEIYLDLPGSCARHFNPRLKINKSFILLNKTFKSSKIDLWAGRYLTPTITRYQGLSMLRASLVGAELFCVNNHISRKFTLHYIHYNSCTLLSLLALCVSKCYTKDDDSFSH